MKFGLKTGKKTVASAGTAEALVASKTWVKKLKIVALPGNAGSVYIGDSSVDDTTGVELAAGAVWEMADVAGAKGDDVLEFDLNSIYVDAANNDDGVSYSYGELS
jgi:hypothetical protein